MRTPIGLDIGAHSLKAVQMVSRGKSWEVTSAICLPKKSADSNDLSRLENVLARQGFIGRQVIIAAQASKVMTGVLELPARAAGVPMDEIARAEFCRMNKVEASDVVTSYWELPAPARASKATYAMAVGCLSSDAEIFIDQVEAAGLDVLAIDAAGSATARACLPLATSKTDMTGVLDLGWSASVLGILRGGVLVYERRIPEAGLCHLADRIAKETSISTEDAQHSIWHTGVAMDSGKVAAHVGSMIDELQQAIGYVRHQYPDSASPPLLLAGGGAQIPGVAELIESSLQLKVRVAETSEMVTYPQSLARVMSPAMLCAIGLAQFDAR